MEENILWYEYGVSVARLSDGESAEGVVVRAQREPCVSLRTALVHMLDVMGWNAVFLVTAYSPFEERGQYVIAHLLANVMRMTQYFIPGAMVRRQLRSYVRKQISHVNCAWSLHVKKAREEGRDIDLTTCFDAEHHDILDDLDEYLFGLTGVLCTSKETIIARQRAAKIRRLGKKGRAWVAIPFPPSGRFNTAGLALATPQETETNSRDEVRDSVTALIASPAIGGAAKRKRVNASPMNTTDITCAGNECQDAVNHPQKRHCVAHDVDSETVKQEIGVITVASICN
jgi:hypothetical protein